MSEPPLKMLSYILQSLRNERALMLMGALLLLMYFFIMDMILYVSLQNSTLLDQKREGEPYSPFHPLSIKLLMTDSASHYIINPTTECFDKVTQFSKVFYFITPNVISMTHLILGLTSARFVASESLRDRRIGVVMYEFRTWLDGLDGVVYRSQSGMNIYKSNRSEFGYIVDIATDIISGFALCFGVLFYLWKCPPASKTVGPILPESIPWIKPAESNGSPPVTIEKTNSKPSKKYIFFKVLCFGSQLGIASSTWDRTVDNYSKALQIKMATPQQTLMQTQALHSTTTCIVIWLWRLCEGQSMLQMILVAIFIDKIWEFLNLVQYVGFVVLAALNIFSEIHLQHLKQKIGI